MKNFNFLDRKEFYDCLKVNPNLEIRKVKYDDFEYLSVENFFLDPEKAIDCLKHYPALDGGVATPGARQNFTPMDVVPVLQAYKAIVGQIGMKIDPTSFITSSNIAWKGVDVMKGSMYPHYDYELVCNLWLCDYNGGTAFYKYKGHTSISDIDIPDYRKPKEPTVPWENFDGDDAWELYFTIPTKYNTVALYNGKKFHSPYADLNDDYRYSLISFYHTGKKF